jgi:hypothetical protein
VCDRDGKGVSSTFNVIRNVKYTLTENVPNIGFELGGERHDDGSGNVTV